MLIQSGLLRQKRLPAHFRANLLHLRGKKIAISCFGSSSDVAVRHAVERYDLKPDKDVIILN